VLFGELLPHLAEAGSTSTYRNVLRFRKLTDLDYLVLRYLKTGVTPFEDWPENWLYEGEVLTSRKMDKGCGGDVI
jgi:hypothetical protein